MVEIKLGEAEVLGIDNRASGLLNVAVPLTPAPDENWTRIFHQGPTGPMWPMSMHPAVLQSSTVMTGPRLSVQPL
jgi:hypothetical protein